MASRRRKTFDPNAVHFPNREGPVCGAPAPTDAHYYAIDRAKLTCAPCLDYFDKVAAWGKIQSEPDDQDDEDPEGEAPPAPAPRALRRAR